MNPKPRYLPTLCLVTFLWIASLIPGCASQIPEETLKLHDTISVPGYAAVVERFASTKSGFPLRIIARASVQPAQVSMLGVKNATSKAIDDLVSTAAAAGAIGSRRIGSTDLVVFEITRANLDKLLLSGKIGFVQIDDADRPTLDSAVPVVSGMQAQIAGATGLGQNVVVLDTGVEASHIFFNGRVVDEACFSSTTASSVTYCPNETSQQLGHGAAQPCPPNVLDCFHGTHVAGIVGGSGSGLTGIAPRSNIIAVQVFSHFPNGAGGCTRAAGCSLSYVSDQIRGLDYVLNTLSNSYPIAAINMSLGGGSFSAPCPNDARAPLIDALRSRGIATVIATANDSLSNAIGAPACIPSAIAVGAASDADIVAPFSNSSAAVDLMAPGVSLKSSAPGNLFAIASGTSMASPMVSGAIAGLQSYYLLDVPTVELALIATGKPIPILTPGIQKPRIDVLSALGRIDALVPVGDFVWMKDTWSDTGREPDPLSAGQPMHESPYIWVRNQKDCVSKPHQHQNPEFGQVNYGCIKIQNSGKAQAKGTLQLYMAEANLDDSASWKLVGAQTLTLPAKYTTIVELPWANLPAPGHYCLLARWKPEVDPPKLSLPGGVVAAVSNSKHLVWHNVNIIDAAAASTSSKISIEPSNDGTYNLVVDISRLDSNSLQQLGELIIQLGGDPVNLALEPTSAMYKYEGRWISIPLKPGVYYIPDIKTTEDGSTTNLEFVRGKNALGVGERARLKVDLFRVPSIADHKEGRSRATPGVTYMFEGR